MRIHFIGCEGASMKVLRKIAQSGGAVTTGSDLSLSGHDAEFCRGADLAVYSSAIPEDNPELTYARENNIRLLSRAEFLGRLAAEYSAVIAVAGSHGKTTCTAMLGCIFSPYNATVHLGGEYGGECGHVGNKRLFITEACEYKRNFLHISPRISVVLNVELDHTDYYRDIRDVTNAFDTFSRSAPVRILCGDDERSAELRTGKYITFGCGENCDFRAENIVASRNGTVFTLVRHGQKAGVIRLKVMGRHNVLNALAAAAAATAAGARFDDIKRGLDNFTGASRRLEYLGRRGDCDIFTDYAHHPREIDSCIKSLREAGYAKVGIAFEPHTYTRTQSLLGEFVSSLGKADDILFADIYAARETPVPGVSSQLLCRKILDSGKRARCFCSYFELNEAAARCMEHDSAFVYCGAGTIDIAGREIPKSAE